MTAAKIFSDEEIGFKHQPWKFERRVIGTTDRVELLSVLHNTRFGHIPLRRGKWVEVQGVYLHSRRKYWGPFGRKLSFYGNVHYTHFPRGYIRVLDRKPSDLGEREIISLEYDKGSGPSDEFVDR